MRNSLKALFLFIVFAGSASSIMAQATKEVFNTAVDHINCETIRFIHREAGRAEVANNMDCLSFESIYKSIPADEAGTTGALCKNINDYKNKFKEDKPLDEQLNTVIAYADAKIAAKKRKGNVEDFKANLEKIKKDALDAAKGTPAANNTATAKTTEPKATAADTSQAISEPAATGNATITKGHKTDWLGLLALLVGLGALGLAYMAYSKAKKIEGGSINSVSTGPGNKSTRDEFMQEIIRVEKKLTGEITNLKGVIDDLIKKGGTANTAPSASAEPLKKEAPVGYIHDEEKAKSEERKAEAETERRAEGGELSSFSRPERDSADKREAELVAKPEDIIDTSQAELIPKPEEPMRAEGEREREGKEEQKAEYFSPYSNGNEAKTDAEPQAVSDLFGAATPKPVQNQPGEPEKREANAPMNYSAPTAVAEPEPFMPEKEYEDGEAVPFYKFTGLPNEDGYFEANSFTDEPEKDSVYEIEMYEDVPDKAFFSIRSNPDVIRRAILDPQTYLAPCCTYTDDPAGKHTIVLVEEGMLRKENNKWVVYEKAKINFE